MNYGFKQRRLEGEIKLPYKVIEKEGVLSDGTTGVFPVKVYQQLENCGLSQVVTPSQLGVWSKGIEISGI